MDELWWLDTPLGLLLPRCSPSSCPRGGTGAQRKNFGERWVDVANEIEKSVEVERPSEVETESMY